MKTSAVLTTKTLTPAQKQAIETTQKWVGIIAGAGSGKTTVLIERCLNIIKNDPEKLNNFLIITFTEKAAGELLERLRKHIPKSSQHILLNAWIGTFHSFCARILRKNAPLINLDPNFQILNENEMHLLVQQTCASSLLDLLDRKDEQALLLINELDFKYTLSMFNNLCNFRWHASQILKHPATGSEQEISIKQAIKHCYFQIEANILTELQAKGALDFQQLEIDAFALLNNFPKIRNVYQHKFKHILVDEFQDTNDIQSQLVFTLANPKFNCLAIVGDPHQSIYRFRGANVACFENALQLIRENNGQVITLAENFRSEPEIVSFANSIFNFHQLIPARPDAKKCKAVQSLIFDKAESSVKTARQKEACALVEEIKRLIENQGFNYSDIACLFQAMTNLEEYESIFKKFDIPYRFIGGKGLLEKRETNDLINVLAYAANPKSKVALYGLLRSPFIGLSDEQCLLFSENKFTDNKLEILDFLRHASLHLKASEILSQTIERTGYDLICDMLDESGSMTANLERIIGLAKSLEKSGPITLQRFVDFLNEMKNKGAYLGDPTAGAFSSDAIACLTVHASKGLEFPVVILPDLLRQKAPNTGPWRFIRNKGLEIKPRDPKQPFGKRRETEAFKELKEFDLTQQEQELQRLLYVAMTRAQDRLIIPIHKKQKTRSKWHDWLCSATDKCSITNLNPGQELFRLDKPLQLKLSKHSSVPKITSIKFQPKFVTVSELEAYARCPQQYFLKYHLGLPSEDFFTTKPERIPANTKGSIIHEVIQKYDPKLKIDIKDLIKAACLNAQVNPSQKSIHDIEKSILGFLQNDLAKEIDQGERELDFDWKFENTIITGTIDWLKPLNNDFEIIDFKTDQITKQEAEEQAKAYELQLATYALALNVKKTKLYFLEPDVIWSMDVTKQRAHNYKLKLKEIINNIKQEKFEINKEAPCIKCPFYRNGICKQKTHE